MDWIILNLRPIQYSRLKLALITRELDPDTVSHHTQTALCIRLVIELGLCIINTKPHPTCLWNGDAS